MIVISLSNCPPSLRGDLTKWLFEISTNVFVGRMSGRVRDEIWDRIVSSCKNGRAIMVFGASNEQRFDFRVHNGEWELADLDGLKVMLRPLPGNQAFTESKYGYSKASKYRKSKQFSRTKQSEDADKIVFVAIKTTGPDPGSDRLLSIGSIIAGENNVYDTFLWGSSCDVTVSDYNCYVKSALIGFFDFLGGMTVVFEDISRSLSFIEAECNRQGIETSIEKRISLKSIGKKNLYNLKRHDIKSLQEYYGIQSDNNDTLSECLSIAKVYYKMTSDNKQPIFK
ncbi:MAG: type I-E CRISPR-associated endoribonuclease Cas2e [Methanosarcina sp.]